jgi:deoxyribodipyrimidine photolyase-related protein
LVFVLGDQLDHNSPLLKDLDPKKDLCCMAEVVDEAICWCHKSRLVFFSAMRHFAQELQERGLRTWYHELSSNAKQDQVHSLAEALEFVADTFRPERIEVLEPGDLRIHRDLKSVAKQIRTPHSL